MGDWLGKGMNVLLSAGSGAHLMAWCKRRDERTLIVKLAYRDGAPEWCLAVIDGEQVRFEGKESSLEACMLKAVAALGPGGVDR